MKRIEDYFIKSVLCISITCISLFILAIIFLFLFDKTNFYKNTFIVSTPLFSVIEGGAHVCDTAYGYESDNGEYEIFVTISEDSLAKMSHDDSILNRSLQNCNYVYKTQDVITGKIDNYETSSEQKIGDIIYDDDDRFRNYIFVPLYVLGGSWLFLFVMVLIVLPLIKSYIMPNRVLFKNKFNAMKYKILIIPCLVIALFAIFNPSPQSFFYYIKGINGYTLYNPPTYRDANYLLFSKYNYERAGEVHSYIGVLGNFYKIGVSVKK